MTTRKIDLKKVWNEQLDYNANIRAMPPHLSTEQWTEKYLLGLVSEVDEILREINWKHHRNPRDSVVQENLAMELADLTKYIFSLWQIWGYTPNEMLAWVDRKNEILYQQLLQDFAAPPQEKIVLIFDLDGTVADWRRSFEIWVNKNHQTSATDLVECMDADISNLLLADHDLKLPYAEYTKLKHEFEQANNYQTLRPYHDVVDWIRLWQQYPNHYSICYTARPVHKYKNIWHETWQWLETQKITPNELHLDHEGRVLKAIELQKENTVVVMEDNPELIVRYVNNGIPVLVQPQPYNKDITSSDSRIHAVNNFGDLIVNSVEKWSKNVRTIQSGS